MLLIKINWRLRRLICWCLSVPCSMLAYGCCPNGVDPALGPNYAGCESVSPEACASTDYGCCLDGISTATGPNFAGCPATISFNQSETGCSESAYGCCEDGVTPAYGPHSAGCSERIKYGGNLFVATEFSSLLCYRVNRLAYVGLLHPS